ncbi:hypothetical protein L1987_68275 [Smallanthus sonchifolius]|uniref:Uncharacterized protein n=1 Tax=Smallanthus sonchifolius TaxID=185202 RepID=A0ACB9B3D1_9ASTR|nr:hypothetical protein L1987_68275 [Smallanthus sonchifolius]
MTNAVTPSPIAGPPTRHPLITPRHRFLFTWLQSITPKINLESEPTILSPARSSKPRFRYYPPRAPFVLILYIYTSVSSSLPLPQTLALEIQI